MLRQMKIKLELRKLQNIKDNLFYNLCSAKTRTESELGKIEVP